ncbi:MAG: hypothetical protein K8S54_00680 [Spirochaetia bacterium]|nr:hypothetical protein [Spirochaetia bacterium]
MVKRHAGLSIALALLFFLLGLLACRSIPGKGNAAQGKIEVDGRTRAYLVYAPAASLTSQGMAQRFRGMIFVLHGGGGHADRFAKLAPDIFSIADSLNLFLVFPQGVDESWNDGRLDPISTAHKENINDVAFLNALADKLGAEYSIPRTATYIMGISNGGMMSQRAVCDSDRFQRAVSIAANFPEDYTLNCNPSGPRSVLFILGTEDPLVPFVGGPIKLFRKTRGNVLSAENSVKYWREKNRCSEQSTSASLPDTQKDETTAKREIWNCPGGRVGIVTVTGGGHTWPGGKQYLPVMIVGRTSRDFSASKMALDWMLQE